jgi:hypothetical protein
MTNALLATKLVASINGLCLNVLLEGKMALGPDSNCDNQDCWNPNCKYDPCECFKEKPCGYPFHDCCVVAPNENAASSSTEMD